MQDFLTICRKYTFVDNTNSGEKWGLQCIEAFFNKGGQKMYRLKNYMEELVATKTDELLKLMNICKCEKCRLDIIAIALNELPTKYVVSEIGELYTKLNELEVQFEIDVETAIVKAAVLVSKNPKH